MLLTACASHVLPGQSNMRSFSSSLAVHQAHVLVEEVNKSTQNKSTRNRNVTNFCQVLTSSGKSNKVYCPSFNHKNFIGAILNKVLTVICEVESRAQRCLSRAGEGAGTALCAQAGMPI